MSLPEHNEVGVIIGRFQVPYLHAGHKKLIDLVCARHQRVLVLLAVPVWVGPKNPLDYFTRKAMFLETYPNVMIDSIRDEQTDEEWSSGVDNRIRYLFPFSKATLYGGRDGFVRFYRGSYPTMETVEDPTVEQDTGTSLRQKSSALPVASVAFRAGVIYNSMNTPTRPVMCVDAAIVKNQHGIGPQVLLIQKPGEKRWRFPGGHLEADDESLEHAVNREAREETGVEVGTPMYIGSECGIPEWRALQGGIAIASSLFYLPYIYGATKAGDDAAQAEWFTLANLTPQHMEDCHKGFLTQLIGWVAKHWDHVHQYSQGSKESNEPSTAN